MNDEIISKAVSRLTDELKDVKGDKYVQVTKYAVAEALMDCCNQSEYFAARLLASDKSLTDCLTAICKGIGSSISDADLFRRAVKFYLPEAELHLILQIICGEEPENKVAEEKTPTPSPERKIINIFDML